MTFLERLCRNTNWKEKNQVKKREKRYIDIVLQIKVNTISEFLLKQITLFYYLYNLMEVLIIDNTPNPCLTLLQVLGIKLCYQILSIFRIQDLVIPDNFSSFEQFLLILGHVANEIQILLATWGVTNEDLLLLATLQYLLELKPQIPQFQVH